VVDAANPFDAYAERLTSLSDRLTPLLHLEVTERLGTQWYNAELRQQKMECRRLERKWKRTGLHIDMEIYHTQRRNLSRLRNSTKANYFKSKLRNARSPKDSNAIINALLYKSKTDALPAHTDVDKLADEFASFFSDKIANIRRLIPSTAPSLCLPLLGPSQLHCGASTR
jgi:hypothetical protein